MSLQSMTGTWSYRMPFAVQFVWPVPLFILISMAPESPWWLVRHGKIEQAEQSVRRLASRSGKNRAKDTVSSMVRTNQLEIDVSAGTTYLDLFRGTDRSVSRDSRDRDYLGWGLTILVVVPRSPALPGLSKVCCPLQSCKEIGSPSNAMTLQSSPVWASAQTRPTFSSKQVSPPPMPSP